jgi:cytochrome d ubiquinol oxidase subunit II
MALAAGAGVASLLVLWQRIYPLAPPVAAATVALVLAGWGVAQYPYLIPPTERIGDLAAGPATLNAFLVSLAVGAVILIPSLFLLYATFSEKTGGPEAAASGYEHDA